MLGNRISIKHNEINKHQMERRQKALLRQKERRKQMIEFNI